MSGEICRNQQTLNFTYSVDNYVIKTVIYIILGFSLNINTKFKNTSKCNLR